MKKGFRYGDSAPMAIIELVDRDKKAKTQDVPLKENKNEEDKNKKVETVSS